MNVLDCSLRDGGFLNDWGFSSATMDRLVAFVADQPVDYIEVGYLDDAPGLTECAVSSPETLKRLQRISPRLAGMIRPTCPDWQVVLRARIGLVQLVRVTVQANNPSLSFEIAREAKALGFKVTLNITNVSAFAPDFLAQVAAAAPHVDALYLADSRGNLEPKDVRPLVAAVRGVWTGEIGFHPHNNRQWAVENSAEALAAGCTWLDGSVCGMGLGGRNLRLEEALRLAGRSFSPALQEAQDEDWELPAGTIPFELYRLAGRKNWPQDWVDSFVDELGVERVKEALREVPSKPWFEVEAVRPWLAPRAERAPFERMRIYQSQGADHEAAARVFHDLVQPVHEKYGAIFLSRDVLSTGETIVRWLYPSEQALEDIQKAVATDPDTLKNKAARMRHGLHGRVFVEYHLPRK